MSTLGEKRVRIDFNVSGSGLINDFKIKSADLINILEDMRNMEGLDEATRKEYNRLISLSQTSFEEACSWAVKAITI